MWHVYQIQNLLNGKRYVGLTKHLRLRRWTHSRGDPKCVAIGNAIKKHGWENFSFTVLGEYVSAPNAAMAETLFIRFLGSKVPGGYNICDGGEGALGAARSAEYRVKMSQRLAGRDAHWMKKPKSPEHQAKITVALHARLADPERSATWREAMRQAQVRRWTKWRAARCLGS